MFTYKIRVQVFFFFFLSFIRWARLLVDWVRYEVLIWKEVRGWEPKNEQIGFTVSGVLL